MRIWVLDTESDGLLDTISKFHVFVFKEYKKDNWKVFCNKEELPEWFIEQTDLDICPEWLDLYDLGDFLLEDVEALACHNILGFDLRAWKLLEYIDNYTIGKDTITVAGQTKEIRIFDTLVMSRSLNPDRMLPFGCPTKKYNEVTEKFDTVGAHGLDSWGYRVSNAKPKVDDWRDQPLHVYVNRCIEDVKINELTLTELIKESKDKAVNSKQQKGDWAVPLRLATKDYYLMVMQEETGCPFDSEAAEELIIRIDGMMKEIEEDVEPQLPLRDIPKSKRPNFPAKPFTDSGEISAHGWNWLVRLGYPVDKEVLEFKAPPKTAFKGDGDVSKAGERYCINNGVEDPEQMPQYLRECKRKSSCKPLPDDLMDKAIQSLRDKEEPCMKEPMSISNQADIKDYLVFQEGWKPLHWRTKDITRDDNKRNVKDVVLLEKAKEYIDSVKESPYKEFIYEEYNLNFDKAPYEKVLEFVKKKGRYLITSPQLKDDRGNLCENLDRLKGDLAKQIVKWLSLRNRRSVIKAMDETKDTGWLNNDRIAIDGRLSGAHSGLTNTHRKKHRVIN